jgi:hypothetical protein
MASDDIIMAGLEARYNSVALLRGLQAGLELLSSLCPSDVFFATSA